MFVLCAFSKQKVHDRMAVDQTNIDACSRSFILKMHSLIHNQLKAERFSRLVEYGGYSSGYISKDPGYLKNVYNVYFSIDDHLCSLTA